MATSTTSTRPAKARPPRPWFSRVLALLTLFCFGAGGLMLADSLHQRDETAARVVAQYEVSAGPPPAPPIPVDEGMYAYLPPEVEFGPIGETRFAADQALYAAGPSHVRPEVTFQRILQQLNPDGGVAATRAAMKKGPGAADLLRMQASIGILEGVAFLVRMPLDVEAFGAGRFRTESGGIVLAYVRARDEWEYLTFYFPRGLDLDAYAALLGPPKNALEPLGPEVESLLQPSVAIGGGTLGRSSPGERRLPKTVICRARGRTGQVLDRAVAALQRRGWQPLPGVEGGEREDTRVLSGPRGQVWFTTSDRLQRDGMITVMMALP